MGKNQSASGLTNIIQYDNNGNVSFVSGSTTLMQISSSGAITTTGVISGSNALSASYALNSGLLNGTGSVGFATTASLLTVSSSQQQISASQQQLSSSFLILTASFNAVSSSQQQISASYIALSASYNTFSGSASTRITVDSASLLQVSSSQQQISASYTALSGSYNVFSGSASTRITANSSSIQQVSSSQQQISASLLQVSASYISLSGSYNTYSSSISTRTTQIENVYATTGSNSFRANQSITGSLVVSSTITAQTLIVQTVTSSIVYSSGSNVFGCDLNSRQTFTGSVLVTGSLTIAGASSATSYSGATIYGSTVVCSPVGKFTSCIDVGGTGTFSSAAGIANGNGLIFRAGGNTASDGNVLNFTSLAGTVNASMFTDASNSNTRLKSLGNLSFHTGNIAISADNERMFISSSGAVGIGTSSPKTYSTLTNNGQLINLNNIGIDVGQSYRFNNYYNSGTGTDRTITTGFAGSIGYDNSVGAMTFSTSTTSITADNNVTTTERMRITCGGNVYIGATTGTYPSSGYVFGVRATGGTQTFMSITAPSDTLDSQGLVIGVDSSAGSFYMRDAKFMNFFTNNTERMRITSTGIACFACQICAPANSSLFGTASTTGPAMTIQAGSNCRAIIFKNAGGADGSLWLYGTSNTINYSFSSYSVSDAFVLYNNGNYDFYGSDVSDRRQKDNICYITDSQIYNIMKLKSVSFNKKTLMGGLNSNVHTGFIAQDVLEAGIPNLVHGKEEEGYGLDYNGILSLAVKAIQEQQCKIALLESCLGIA